VNNLSNSSDDSLNGVKSSAETLKSDIRTTVSHAKESVRGIAAEAGKQAHQKVAGATRKISGRVETRPLQSGFFVMALGFIMGALLRK
jgi:hypothetical protein